MSAAGPDAKEIFLDALDLRAELRPGFLAAVCGEDGALRERVEELLGAHAAAEGLALERASRSGERGALDLEPGARIGPYVLLSELGAGGFGRVFRARQEAPVRREVALKVVKLGMDTKRVIARFEVERQALALMDHPHIARVLDAGTTEGGRPYFVMELVDGEPLTKYCERRAFDLRQRIELLREVALAIQHAHQKGVVHRDVKPSNVLVTTVDGRPLPKVIDFGIAKALAPPAGASLLTAEGDVIGTPAYMSPEQVLGDARVDTRADVYSLGALLYELIARRPPFDPEQLRGSGVLGIARAVLEVDPERPSSRPGGRAVPADLDWITMRCLEKDPARRYPTAFALAADLERFLAGLPVEAAPPSTWYRTRKLVQRHRALSAALVLVTGILLLGILGTSMGLAAAVRANEDLDRALGREQQESLRARSAEEQAREQAEVARAVLEFLNEVVLGSVRPSEEAGRGRGALLVEVLDAAALRIEADSAPGGRFADQPLVEAGVREAIAGSYHSLGLYTQAEPHLARAAQLRAAQRDSDPRAALRVEGAWAVTLRKLGRYGEALELGEGAQRAARAALGPADPETLAAENSLATLYLSLGRRGEARELLESALARAEGALGPLHARTLELCGSFAIVLAQLGQGERARELFERVLAGRRRTLGERHPSTVAALSNLASQHQSEGHNELAEVLLAEALEAQRELLGPDHPDTLVAAQNLGSLLRELGRYGEARVLLEQVHGRLGTQLGADHPSTLRAALSLASLLSDTGQHAQAEASLRRLLEVVRVQLGEDHPLRLNLQKELTSAVHRQGRLAEAEALAEDLLRREERVLGAADPASVRSRISLAILRGLQGDPEGKLQRLRQLFEELEPRLAEDDPLLLDVRGEFGAALCDLDRYPEAEPHARRVRELLARGVSAGESRQALAAYRLGVAVGGQGRFAEAEELLLEAEQRFSASRGRSDPQTLEAVFKLELVYRLWGRADEAAHWALELSERRGGPF